MKRKKSFELFFNDKFLGKANSIKFGFRKSEIENYPIIEFKGYTKDYKKIMNNLLEGQDKLEKFKEKLLKEITTGYILSGIIFNDREFILISQRLKKLRGLIKDFYLLD